MCITYALAEVANRGREGCRAEGGRGRRAGIPTLKRKVVVVCGRNSCREGEEEVLGALI